MSLRLILKFLGLPEVFLDDKPIATDRRKAIALLAYLAVNDIGHPRQRYSRESLSALLWPDYDQAKAFANLRRVIWEIHQAIGESWLIAERESVHLNEDVEMDLDVAHFRDWLSQSRQQNDPTLRVPLLVDAVKLYRDHFLTGFSLKDAPNFNEWAFAESEDLRHKLTDALIMLSEDHCGLGQADQAIPYARRLVTLDPLNEASHRLLMQVYVQAGQHSAALKQYQTCEKILRKELNLDPQPETRALYKKILKGEMKPVRVEKQAEKVPPKHNLPLQLTTFIGREKGLDEIKNLLANNLPTGTVTFLFTDIEGSTQLWERHPEAMKTAHARHESILRQAVAAHGGYAYKMIGDAFQVAFATALEALAAALDAQRALHAEPWPATAPIRVRMALHTGVTEERGDDYVGPVLNRVARLLGVGHGGQVLLTQPTYDLVRDDLPQSAALRDLGEHNLKDLIRPEHIYQLIAPGLQSDHPPLKTIDSFPHNLPLQLTTFIGREKEQAEITKLIAKNRLVTLVGTGGIGKTRLSLEAAREMRNAFPNGMWFIELAPLSDPALVPQAIVTTLGLIEQANRSPQTILIDFLKAKRALLILDNCEHLIQACAQLTETLLRACPDLHILATSREALGVPGEIIFSVPTLSFPNIDHLLPIETLTQYEAVKLFIERAHATLSNFSITSDNAPAIAQICHYLDGIPLALELAAARVRGLSVEQIASRLNDRFRLLTGGSRTALPRHQTLQALIDWSHNLLSKPERVLLSRLSVFAGGWTLEAAESVCAGDGLESDQILDLLLRLVDKSLVGAETQGAEPRYHMSETIREYAREKLWAVGEGEMIRQRHLAYFVELAERAEPNLRAFEMVMWLYRLEAEHDNIREALAWALESDVEAQLRLASALLWFWHIRDHKNEGTDWLEQGLSIEAAERDDQPLTPARAMIRGKALNANGSLMAMTGEFGKAATRLEESLTLFQELDLVGKQGMAYALLRLGGLPSAGNQARSLLAQSLTMFRELGEKFGVAECLMLLADGEFNNGDYKQMAILREEHLALRREIGDQDGIASALLDLGNLAFAQDDYQRAIALYGESLTGFRAVGNKWMVGMILSNLGRIAQAWGDYKQAAQQFTEALTMEQDLGMREAIAVTLHRLGQMAWALGDYAQAAKKYEEALPLFREMGNKNGIAGALYAAGKVAWAQDNYEQAGRRYEEVLALGRERENKLTIAYALYGLGKVAQAKGDYASARSSHIEALTIRLGMGNRRAIAYSLAALAALTATQQKAMRAARLFGAAENLQKLIHFRISPRERSEHDQAVAAARAALGEEAFTAAWEEGQKMTLEQAVAYALEET